MMDDEFEFEDCGTKFCKAFKLMSHVLNVKFTRQEDESEPVELYYDSDEDTVCLIEPQVGQGYTDEMNVFSRTGTVGDKFERVSKTVNHIIEELKRRYTDDPEAYLSLTFEHPDLSYAANMPFTKVKNLNGNRFGDFLVKILNSNQHMEFKGTWPLKLTVVGLPD
jgi:hypothetical protein